MPLSNEEIREIAQATAKEVLAALEEAEEELATRDLLVGMVVGEGAIPVHGRENRKAVCYGCRIDPDKPLEAGNVMATTKDAIGMLSAQEVRDWCSEIVERPDGRCDRAMAIRKAAQKCKAAHPDDSQAYFACFVPEFRAVHSPGNPGPMGGAEQMYEREFGSPPSKPPDGKVYYYEVVDSLHAFDTGYVTADNEEHARNKIQKYYDALVKTIGALPKTVVKIQPASDDKRIFARL